MLFKKAAAKETVDLPEFNTEGETSLEQALSKRKSTRSYADKPLKMEEAAQLLWAAQGVNRPRQGFRTAPSAGALFPLEVFLVAGNVEELDPGVYRYLPKEHKLKKEKAGNVQGDLHRSALGQSSVRDAPAVLVIAGIYERTTGRYGDRGRQYVHMEVGHAGQNIHLQAETLGLGTVVIGAFDDSGVQAALGL
ncbi:SagB/ThcOx family dehydrogenase, partial [Desulfonatronospira sp.]|uniref:SagB/ThcOx family dehydrogenase n=1 Tax=Desulfonatronospira sp. TaxID=1962951 RepID=UPI0025C6FAB2